LNSFPKAISCGGLLADYEGGVFGFSLAKIKIIKALKVHIEFYTIR